MLLGAAFAVAVAVATFWRRIMSFFRRSKPAAPSSSAPDAPPVVPGFESSKPDDAAPSQ